MGQAASYNSRKSRSNYTTNIRKTVGICNGGWTIIMPTGSVDQCWMGSKDDEADPKREVIWKVIEVVAQLILLLYRF